MRRKFPYHYFLFLIGFFVTACNQQQEEKMFTKLEVKESGIDFTNDIHGDIPGYSFINEFGYMGGGVGIGDFNNDGLPDIFFTANQVSSRLYINQGNNRFKDITESAGLLTRDWCTGVSIVDINQDGYDDIYVAVYGRDLSTPAHNLLFINQQNLTFTEQAAAYGLADTGYSTQAVFFDYDRDGDLDMFLVNYLLSSKNGNSIFPRDQTGKSPANDRLYRNDGDREGVGHPVFTDVSVEAGIKEDGYGLSACVSDFNRDGWPDIYVANDFITNDELWINNQDGTFTNYINKAFRHQSYSSMGSDAADVNNDGLIDVFSLDMLPEYNERRKISFSFMNYDRYMGERGMGYEPQFMRNMLQLNNGNRNWDGRSIPFFSEIGELAGVDATDWSWSVLMADFDNDGWKDVHVTNGIGKDFINADFLEFSQSVFRSDNLSREAQQKEIRDKLSSLAHVNLPNYLFINNRRLGFTDHSEAAGINELSMSNGAAYVDLDNDGDLDLIVNNINQPAFVFINNTRSPAADSANHFLSVQLAGSQLNRAGIGSKVYVYNNSSIQVQEQSPVRGYLSSVDYRLLFGLGDHKNVDSLIVIWPDGKRQTLYNLQADSRIILDWKNAVEVQESKFVAPPVLFSDIISASGIAYLHHENIINDFETQPLLPQKFSQAGPFLTTGDINGDGRTDFFVGGAYNFSGKIFFQNNRAAFDAKNLIDSVKYEEDSDCILFDADNDGDLDLLITAGDGQYDAFSPFYKPRMYLNDGSGNFSLNKRAIPDSVRTIAGTVIVFDYDGDGDKDVFIGGRVSNKFPLPPGSYLLRNDEGVFTDVTESVCPALKNIGMVTSAVSMDFDGDGREDLVVAGEWMPLRFFKNSNGKLIEVTADTGLKEINGMWRSLVAADMDGDGDLDLVAGNLGLNSSYRVSAERPMELFATDIDGNGSIDPLLFYYVKTKDGSMQSRPAINRSQLSYQVPVMKKRFLSHEDYAGAGFKEIFGNRSKDGMLPLFCNETRSCYFENKGNGVFEKHPLPLEAQFAPVNAILCADFDRDGHPDILLAGNEYQTEVIRGRYDASYGCFLRGNGKGDFTAVTPVESGFIVDGDVKDMAVVRMPDHSLRILVAVNNDSLRVFTTNVN
ncbi:MAG: VCBS repeat-containing protein [Chitinophagaceae bacterium]|nr:VCBS repeat-containing protein [Chitinophagaceae bacterium]